MTARRELNVRLQRLHDVREILASLKNLAYMEVNKLTPRLEAQREAVRLIEQAAVDFLMHFPAHRADTMATAPEHTTLVMIGTERGFCGAFNRQLIEAAAADDARLVAVGRKLNGKLESDARLHAALGGATVAEETESVIAELTHQIGRIGTTAVTLLFHDETGEVQRLSLLPPFRDLPPPARLPGFPPVLNLTPSEFYAELVAEYLFAVLHQVLFASLLAENQQRVRHLEGAVQRLDEQLTALQRRDRQLRQEEITEEIEIILLNTEL